MQTKEQGCERLKILVVDDEHIIRSWIGMVLERSYTGHLEIIKASSGEQALEHLMNGDVDIAITDICMKRMSGLDLIDHAKKAGFCTKFILISNYEEFSYAKEAVRLGASDYLLKSEICDEDILKAVERVKSEMELSNSVVRQHETENINLGKRLFLEELVKGKYEKSKEEWLQSKCKQLSVSLREQNLFVIVIDADSRSSETETEDEFDFHMAGIISQNLRVWFEKWEWIKTGDGKYIVLLNVSSNSNKTTGELLDLFALKIISEMKSRIESSVSVGISRSFKGFSRIHEEYENAVAALDERYFTGGRNIGYYLNIDNRQFINYNNYVQSGIKKIREFLNLWKFKDAAAETGKLLSELPQIHIKNHQDVRQALVRLVSAYYDGLSMLGISGEYVDRLFDDHGRKITGFALYRDATNYVLEILAKLPVIVAAATNSDDVVKHIAEYIKANHNKDLSLADLSETFHLSASHLSKKFKEKMGTNISKYIIDMRIEASKELLRNSELKMSDIAMRVGFSSLSYFAQAFKRLEGCSPHIYRIHFQSKHV